MIKDYQKQLNRLHIVLDALVIIISYLGSWFFLFGERPTTGVLLPRYYFLTLIAIVPVYIALNGIFGLYAPKRVSGRRREIANICKANSIGFLLFTLILFLGSKNPYIYHFSRKLTVVFYIVSIVLETIERNGIRIVLRAFRARGYNLKHILLIGYSRAAESYIDRVAANPEWGYKIRGILDDDKERGFEYKGVRVIGETGNLREILSMNVLDEIAVTLGLRDYDRLEEIVNECERSGVHTKFIPDYHNIVPTIPYTEDLLGLPVINIRHVPLTEFHHAFIKRIVDIFGAIVAIILFSPVMILTAILVKKTSKGPIIFSQERVGLHNQPFRMYKFRSMTVQEESKEKKGWTTAHDPRVTPVGRFIRKTSIDELPQLFNVLKGDMSLVGPRPERPYFVEKFRDEIPHYMIKHQVRPGLTGWAQVNGYRGDTSIAKRIDHDLYYIENWTIGVDFKILFLTIFKGFINKNAY